MTLSMFLREAVKILGSSGWRLKATRSYLPLKRGNPRDNGKVVGLKIPSVEDMAKITRLGPAMPPVMLEVHSRAHSLLFTRI